MKKLLFVIALVAAFCAAAHAQATAQRPEPRLVDEYGRINLSDTLARLDNFAVELQNDPTFTGYIVVYPQLNNLPAWSLRRAYWCKGYLIKSRNLEPARVVVLNGGFGDADKYQLWLVPTGSPPPVPTFDLAAALSRERTPLLYDRRVFENAPPVADGGYENYLSEEDVDEPFVSALRADPASRGLIIAYSTRRNRRGTDRKLAARTKLAVLKLHAIGADRIVAKGGGLRTHRTLEYWIVPPGAELPRPTPTVRPARPATRR